MKKAVLIAVLLLLIIVGSGVVVAVPKPARDNNPAANTRIGTQLEGILKEGDIITSNTQYNGATGATFVIEKRANGRLYFKKLNPGTGQYSYITNNDMNFLLDMNYYAGENPRLIKNKEESAPATTGSSAGTETATPFAGADTLARILGYSDTGVTDKRTGVTKYGGGNKLLFIKSDGTSSEVVKRNNQNVFAVDRDTNGENLQLSYFGGIKNLPGQYPDNQEIIDQLDQLNAFTFNQIEFIRTTGTTMQEVYNILEANKKILSEDITSLDKVPENLKKYFKDANDLSELKNSRMRFGSSTPPPPPSSPKTSTPPPQKTEAQVAKEEAGELEKQISQNKLTPSEASTKTEELARDLDTLVSQKRTEVAQNKEELKKEKAKEETDQNKLKIERLEKEITNTEKEITTLDNTAQDLHKKARQFQWQSHWFFNMEKFEKEIRESGYGQTLITIQSLLARGSKWQALSNAWLGETEWYQAWFDISNNAYLQWWSNLPTFAGTHTAANLGWDACKRDDALRAEIPGQSAQFVETPSGTYQFVGSIMAERSEEKVAVLCERNPDEEAEEEFVCGKKQVCVKDFCYADEDKDGEADPDAEEPLKGYFYKVSWGVSAPADESFTPFVDEDKKAVRFNLQLVGEKSVWLYKRSDASGTAVLALENGANDRAVITHFSTEEPPFNKACLRYDPSYPIKDRYGEQVTDQCVEIIKSDRGTVEFTKSDRSESVTSSSTEVEGNNEW